MADHLERAIDLAVANVADGGGPFSAVVVAPSGQVFEGVNRVTAGFRRGSPSMRR